MSWFKPFLDVVVLPLPQWVGALRIYPSFEEQQDDSHKLDRTDDTSFASPHQHQHDDDEHNNNNNLMVNLDYDEMQPAVHGVQHSLNNNSSSNLSAISMYQRAITLQQSNSDNMNKHILDYSQSPSRRRQSRRGRGRHRTRVRDKRGMLQSPSPSFEPMLSASNNPSDFDMDDEYEQQSDSDSSIFSVFSNVSSSSRSMNAARAGSGRASRLHLHELDESNSNVLSDQEYVELHSSMDRDELKERLYEQPTVYKHAPSWLEIQKHVQNEQQVVYELNVNNEKGKLNERDWRRLLKVITSNKFEAFTLKLNNVVLDKTASEYLNRLSMKKLHKLSIQNAYFENSVSNEEDLYMYTQNEGGEEGSNYEPENDDEEDQDNQDLYRRSNDHFDFAAFCRRILSNDQLTELVINNTNLNDMLVDDEESKQLFMNILSNHRALKSIDLCRNQLNDASLFVDALLVRKVPLDHLHLSYNPLSENDIKSIRWAANKQYVSHLEFDLNFASPLFIPPHDQEAQQKYLEISGQRHLMMLEPIDDDMYHQYDLYHDDGYDQEAENDGDNEQEDEDEEEEKQEHAFISSLFPISNAIEHRNQMLLRQRAIEQQEEEEKKHALNPGLHAMELGIEIRRKRKKRKKDDVYKQHRMKKKVMCKKLVFVSAAEGNNHDDENAFHHGMYHRHHQHDEQGQPGTLANPGEYERNNDNEQHLMLRI